MTKWKSRYNLVLIPRFCGWVDKEKSAIVAVFFSNDALFLMKRSTDIFVDGTFKVKYLLHFIQFYI